MELVKLAGGLLVFCTCSFYGFYRAHLLGRRVRWLHRMVHTLQRLETEIMFAATPLQEALVRAGDSTGNDEVGAFYKHVVCADDAAFHTSWHAAIARLPPFVKHEERESLRQLGESLGASDRLDQQKHLLLCSQRLQTLAAEAHAEQLRFQGMWRSLGVLGGLLIIILIY